MEGQLADAVRPALVRVGIPHYCNFQQQDDEHGGYGSTRQGVFGRVGREVALSRCLGSLLALNRGAQEEILDIDHQAVVAAPTASTAGRVVNGVLIDCHVFVTGEETCLRSILDLFGNRITLHQLNLEDPKRLPHAVRDFLIVDDAAGRADLSLYLEDDLVIQDPFFFDKIFWFLKMTRHSYAVMPHRFECTGDLLHPRLFVDGPIDPVEFPQHHQPCEQTAVATFHGQSVKFDVATNPHSGSFSMSATQRALIANAGVDDCGFVGPLETVATWTVLKHFPVLKPSWPHRDFLVVEHAFPSFLYLRQSMK